MQATIKKWGNSYAVRLTKKDLDRLHLKEGDTVDVQLMRPLGPIDLTGLPTFRSGQSDVSENHDTYLYG